MKETTIKNYTNPRGIYNTPHFAAWALANKLTKLGFHNLRYRFFPPKVIGVALRPIDYKQTLVDGEDFTPDMFAPSGLFHEMPLNHYVKLESHGEEYLINAGYLLNHFIISDTLGYKEYVRLLNAEDTPSTEAAKGSDSKLPEESPSQQE